MMIDQRNLAPRVPPVYPGSTADSTRDGGANPRQTAKDRHAPAALEQEARRANITHDGTSIDANISHGAAAGVNHRSWDQDDGRSAATIR